MRVVVAGGGIFGVCAAIECRRRGHEVELVEPGPIPHPDASSTDINKIVRAEYGPDEFSLELMCAALKGWDLWNKSWIAEGLGQLYQEVGILFTSSAPMQPGGFEFESYQRLPARGFQPERLNSSALAERFPAWSPESHADGFFHARAGYAESGRIVAALADQAARAGVVMRLGVTAEEILEEGGVVQGLRLSDGRKLSADVVVVACGAWTASLVPELEGALVSTGHPVFHLAPERPEDFIAEYFPVFAADIALTGFYGFPLSREGLVKVARHAPGRAIDPGAPREVQARDHQLLRSFLRQRIPGLADAPVEHTRLCLYSDSQDGDFWLCRHPKRRGLVIAAGGSGHGFKFAPLLGPLIADLVDERPNPWLKRFRWRPELRVNQAHEAARCWRSDQQVAQGL